SGSGGDAPLLWRDPGLPRRPLDRGVGRFRLLRQSDLGAHNGQRDADPEQGRGRRRRRAHAALRGDSLLERVRGSGRACARRRRSIRDRAAHSLRRTARRASHDVLSRPKWQRARVQDVPPSRERVRDVSGASVVIVGGGVMGASVAYHLAARGWRDVVVLDRATGPGLGSTGRATGGFRAQFSTTVNVKLSLLAREKLQRFEDEIGVDPLYTPAGYL